MVADMEAGIGTLTRLGERAVDHAVVVLEPTPRSIDVARRAVAVAAERKCGQVIIVANKLTGDDDRARVADAFSGLPIVWVPQDATVDEADRLGLSPCDVDSGSPAVTALASIAALVDGH